MASSVRLPPQSLETEKALLGALMIRPDSMSDIVDQLSPDAFYAEKHRMIYRAQLALWGKNEPIDIESVRAKLSENNNLENVGGVSYLAELASEVPAASNAQHYANIVQKKFVLRSLIDAGEFVAECGFDEAVELDDTLDKAEKKIYEVAHHSTLSKFVSLRESLSDAWERLEHLQEHRGELRGVPTGFKDLDTLLAGLQKSDLVILAARPSMGKSALALDIARQSAIKSGTVVGIFSLEMGAQQLVDRMVAAEARVNAWNLRTGQIRDPNDFERIRDAYDRLSHAPIFIDDQPANNVLKMRAVARRLKREQGLGLLVVDYLQLMVPTGARASDSLVQQVTEISRSLKVLARELDVPVLALSQLSRAVEQRRGRPRLSDLRDSGCLAGDTKIVDAESGKIHTLRDLARRTEQTPVSVFALDEHHRLLAHAMTRVFPSGIKEIFELKLRSGRTIKASANHPFMKLEGWTRLDALTLGDHIAVPRSLTPKTCGFLLKDAELILLGHLLGDGCILPKRPYHYTSAHEENIAFVENAAKELFGITGRRIRQKNWEHLYLPAPQRLSRGNRHPITQWFERLGIERVRSYEKRIPGVVMESGNTAIALFLRHLWATDGNVSATRLKGRKPAAAIYYASSSRQLAGQVQHLLLRLGIESTLRAAAQKEKYRPMYHVSVEGAPMQIAFLERVGIADRRSVQIPDLLEKLRAIVPNPNTDNIPKEAWRLVVRPAKDAANFSWRSLQTALGNQYNGSALMQTGIGRTRLAAIGELLKSETILELATSEILWDKIVSITSLGEEEVFDATVPEVHNFVAQDIIVHNSIEQDADVVMFIHRDDKMNDNQDRPNVAEILVEKHRNGPVGKVELYFDEKRTTFISMEKSDLSALDATATGGEYDTF